VKFKGKVAIVTGAARGMGYSHCLALAREGADIAAVDICEEEESNKVVNEVKSLGRRGIGIKCNVSKSDEVKAMVDKVLTELGKIDILVNNAGVLTVHSVVDVEEDEWDRVLAVNLKGVFLCCKYVVPHMIKQRSGKIINTASAFGKQGAPFCSPYTASKFGVVGFTESLAREVAAFNINVNAVGPGPVNTELLRGMAPAYAAYLGIPAETCYQRWLKTGLFGREITAEDVSNTVVWLASEDARNLTGQHILVDGGHV
jgi:meso-butanediol dehydrogenase/(S,S)-butanediol dehydrogenase/diacetyl reductase